MGSLMSVWLPAVLYGCQYGCQFSSLSVRSSWGLIRNCSIPVQSSSVRVSVWFGLMSVWLPVLVGLSSVSVWSQFGLSLVSVRPVGFDILEFLGIEVSSSALL